MQQRRELCEHGYDAPSSARETMARTTGASRRASLVARTQRAPAASPRWWSISSSGQPRGVPFASRTCTSGRATASRGPADPCSSGMSLLVARRSVSAQVVRESGNAVVNPLSESTPTASNVFAFAGRAMASAGPISRSWANEVWRGPRSQPLSARTGS